MKTLFLLRHAKASNDNPQMPDFERPLTERGFSDAKLISEAIMQQRLIPEKIISSSAVRAYTTAFIFAAAFNKETSEIDLKDSLYLSTVHDYLKVISSVSDSFSSCLVAGHNNTITMVATHLLGKNIEPMKTCGVLIISSEVNSWKEFDSSPCILQLSLYPSLLKEN